MAAPTVLVILLIAGLAAQQPPAAPPASKPEPAPAKPESAQPVAPFDGPEAPVVTHHEQRAGGKTLRYTATTGFLPIRSAQGEIEARVFFIAYTLDGVADPSKRPLTISFNGGPGSSSVWLHLGALGPKRVAMNDDGTMPSPPYPAGRQRRDVAGPDRPGVCRSGRDRLQPRHQARTGQQVLGRAGRHPVGGRVHPSLRDAIRALAVAAVHGRRKLRHDTRGGAGGTSDRPWPRVQRHPARLVDPQLSDRAIHHGQRPALRAVSADLHGDGVLPQAPGAGTPARHVRDAAGSGGLGGGRLHGRAGTRRLADRGGARRRCRQAGPLHRALTRVRGASEPARSRSSVSARSSCAIRIEPSGGSTADSSASTAAAWPSSPTSIPA